LNLKNLANYNAESRSQKSRDYMLNTLNTLFTMLNDRTSCS